MTAVEPSLSATPTLLDPRTDFIEQVRPYATSPSTRPVTRDPTQIFAKVEEENERRAQESPELADPPQSVHDRVASPIPPAAPTMVSIVRDRRRGSISVSRFGQVCVVLVFILLGLPRVETAVYSYYELSVPRATRVEYPTKVVRVHDAWREAQKARPSGEVFRWTCSAGETAGGEDIQAHGALCYPGLVLLVTAAAHFSYACDVRALDALPATDLSTQTAEAPSALPSRTNSVIINAGKTGAFYQAQKYAGSADSFASSHDGQDDVRDEEQVTQMETIAGRVSLGKAMGGLIARRLSRSRTRSRDILATPSGLLIGVSVEEATTEAEHGEEDSLDAPHTPNGTAFVYAAQADGLRSRRSTVSMPGTAAPGEGAGAPASQERRLSAAGWVAKAKDLTKKFRRKSMAVLPQNSSP
ncbi:uncharacterized protein TRAVEDRAFT_74349 [Trametes versicolor FP-101664 SS1]|uniref:uncharacterized protein n=1 Tax=Trametes versicolor (strain FP-101664) TaxID=717944 RepID=UPI00046240F3|nr:uncharacterized protein TRAVEDRAFT_74349 [Trametes versicolor FP-101664 SS1]EIW54066.1 hypothetical protein TRAVEDRAFT_74349 [Trametes versicolor FP-101664 SS1]